MQLHDELDSCKVQTMSGISVSELINTIELKRQEINHEIENVKRVQNNIKIEQLILNFAVGAVKQLLQNQNQNKRVVRLINIR